MAHALPMAQVCMHACMIVRLCDRTRKDVTGAGGRVKLERRVLVHAVVLTKLCGRACHCMCRQRQGACVHRAQGAHAHRGAAFG